ncbi:hypothetical protein GUITHDRAFT_110996 [Guillardia theta CCMP2712]|uniref:Uncharacterized protein n=1 Tax=Guillardia theta (strain CCMP2712) TaxID=905079 RepID=L1J485_GUITC|nr:hypothetical protein GUITHDRAFT_110996 [Guillardia theta CCMP2712]EKX42949.1 hypothetical protein GUITHDRAFT_110996 [Guillardia theta CCMP2712]|eukprot:XP_005829929.1 hypothetical protein GUITHDRAFT_110996 [Guillardia theta CCMP2712]
MQPTKGNRRFKQLQAGESEGDQGRSQKTRAGMLLPDKTLSMTVKTEKAESTRSDSLQNRFVMRVISERSRRNKVLLKQNKDGETHNGELEAYGELIEQAHKLVDEQPGGQEPQEDEEANKAFLHFVPFVDMRDVRECMPERLIGCMKKYDLSSNPKRLRGQLLQRLEDPLGSKQEEELVTSLLWISVAFPLFATLVPHMAVQVFHNHVECCVAARQLLQKFLRSARQVKPLREANLPGDTTSRLSLAVFDQDVYNCMVDVGIPEREVGQLLKVEMHAADVTRAQSDATSKKARPPYIIHSKGTRICVKTKMEGWKEGRLMEFDSKQYYYNVEILPPSKYKHPQHKEFPSHEFIAPQEEEEKSTDGKDGILYVGRLFLVIKDAMERWMRPSKEKRLQWIALILRLLADPRIQQDGTFELRDLDGEMADGHNAREAIASCLHTLVRSWRWEDVKAQLMEVFFDDDVTVSNQSRCQLLRQLWPYSQDTERVHSSLTARLMKTMLGKEVAGDEVGSPMELVELSQLKVNFVVEEEELFKEAVESRSREKMNAKDLNIFCLCLEMVVSRLSSNAGRGACRGVSKGVFYPVELFLSEYSAVFLVEALAISQSRYPTVLRFHLISL